MSRPEWRPRSPAPSRCIASNVHRWSEQPVSLIGNDKVARLVPFIAYNPALFGRLSHICSNWANECRSSKAGLTPSRLSLSTRSRRTLLTANQTLWFAFRVPSALDLDSSPFACSPPAQPRHSQWCPEYDTKYLITNDLRRLNGAKSIPFPITAGKLDELIGSEHRRS